MRSNPLNILQALSLLHVPDVTFNTTFVINPTNPENIMMDTAGRKWAETPERSEYGPYNGPVQYPPDYCQHIGEDEEFDFVVAGAGTAGTVVARRLADNPGFKVLLLEAGDDPPELAYIPYGTTLALATATWRFSTVTTVDECRGLILDSCVYNTGKCLGGGSVAYYMMYVRGNMHDYNNWESKGNAGWGYKDVMPYFKKFENYNASNYDPTYHGKGGPVVISDWNSDPFSDRVREALFGAAEEIGVKRNYDNNGANQIGPVSLVAAADNLGYRVTVVDAYLKNMPKNLKVCKNALVSHVNLSKAKQATSVNFIHESYKFRKVRARKEIIISAGTVMTPGILERSGIGRPEILADAGVPMIHHLPGVGEHLEDHFVNMACAFAFKVDTEKPQNPLTMALSSWTMFVNTSDFTSSVPTTQYLLFIYEDIVAIGLNFKPSVIAQLSALSNSTSMLIFFASCVLQPYNRGYVHIWDSDVKTSPIITPNHLRDRYELEETVRGVRLARKMFLETAALRDFEPVAFKLKQCSEYEFNSEEEIVCGAQHLATTINHPTGTARMGPDNDPLAVVDPKLRVRGVKGLRVVDASIFPDVTHGNTWAPTLMVAEKGADMIKAAHFSGH